MSEARTLVVAGDGPARLDAFVHDALPTLSRRLVHRLIAERAVLVNDRPAVKGTRLVPGDRVLVPAMPALAAEPGVTLLVRHEDARVLVVEKPAGVAGHALDPREPGTLAAALLGRYPELAGVGDPLAPGLVHRLDTGTSGLVVVARTTDAYAALRAEFRAHAVVKSYAAVVRGAPSAGTVVEVPLAHDPSQRGRMIAGRPGLRAWPASTRVLEVRPYGRWSLVLVEIRTGVTHQVRVHLALAGHPVVGDVRYGGDPAPLADGRHALHASRIVLPIWGLDVTSPLPQDLAALATA